MVFSTISRVIRGNLFAKIGRKNIDVILEFAQLSIVNEHRLVTVLYNKIQIAILKRERQSTQT